jgi:hypothetical protein
MRARALVALALLVSTAAVAGTWKTLLSPGPLVPAHASLDGNCDACHMSFAGIPDSKCLGCHEGLATRIAEGRGFHAGLTGQECITCHGDHGGPTGFATKDAARKAFDHAATGFSLAGSHSDVTCDTCHKAPIGEMAGSCSQCHDDAHASALGPSCDTCHEPIAWNSGLKALSAHLLSMDGKHGSQQCDDCHLHGANLDGATICNDCHREAHGGTKSPCDQCHEVTGFKPAEFDHGPCTCAFPGKHQTVGVPGLPRGLQLHASHDDTPTRSSAATPPRAWLTTTSTKFKVDEVAAARIRSVTRVCTATSLRVQHRRTSCQHGLRDRQRRAVVAILAESGRGAPVGAAEKALAPRCFDGRIARRLVAKAHECGPRRPLLRPE